MPTQFRSGCLGDREGWAASKRSPSLFHAGHVLPTFFPPYAAKSSWGVRKCSLRRRATDVGITGGAGGRERQAETRGSGGVGGGGVVGWW